MKDTDRPTISSRRDAIGLIALTAALVPDAVLAKALGRSAADIVSAPRASARRAGSTGAAVAPDLARLAAEHFEPLVGETFTIGDRAVTLKNVRRGRAGGPRFREQFSVVFQAPQDVAIGSERLPVSHPAVGRHDLLVSRVGNAVDCATLEACFA